MQTYAEYRPTQHDQAGAFLDDDRQDWLVLPVSQTRDSGPLDQSNFACALEDLGGESETVEVHRFGHWGPGWFEIIIVKPDTPEAAKAADMEAALENYPVLDEMDLSRRENEAAEESYDSWGRRDFIRALEKRFSLDEKPDDIDSAIREVFDAAAERSDTYWEPDGDDMTIDIDRIVAEVNLDEAMRILDFSLPPDSHTEITATVAAILESPLAGSVCAMAGSGTGLLWDILDTLRAGEDLHPHDAAWLEMLLSRLDCFPELHLEDAAALSYDLEYLARAWEAA